MIEMFDPQYYLQMYRELQAIAPELEAQEVAKAQERLERIHRQYDVVIRKAEAKLRQGYNKDAHNRRLHGKGKHL